MAWLKILHRNFTKKYLTALDQLLYYFSFRAVPLGIVVISILTLLTLNNQYDFTPGTPLAMRVASQNLNIQSPSQALAELEQQPPTASHPIRAQASPAWFSFTLPASSSGRQMSVEVPSEHAQTLACWNAATQASLGHADRSKAMGSVQHVKSGFVIAVPNNTMPTSILCKADFLGKARLSATLWSNIEMEKSVTEYDRSAGILEGGLLTLTLIVLIFAVINREWMYLLFAAWLLGNLRLSALSMGWDTQWLGHAIPYAWLPFLRKTTIAIYYLLTYSLFTQLFTNDLAHINFPRMQRAILWAGLALLVAAGILPYTQFLPVMWLLTTFGIAVAIFLLSRILAATRSRVALWYSISLGIILTVGIAHTLAESRNIAFLSGSLINVAAALLSSTIVALAIAEHMRIERLERIQAQAELQGTYEVTPIGLFTLEDDGTIVRTNLALEQMLAFIPGADTKRQWTDYFGTENWHKLRAAALQGVDTEIEIQSLAGQHTKQRHFLAKAVRASSRIEGSLQDITEQAHTIAQLRILANHDPLTNTLNQRGIEEKLNESLKSLITGKPFALAYMDLSPLKIINDLYGHTAGDDVLKQVCLRVESILLPGQYLGRVGGDEFVIVFQNCPIERAKEISQKIIDDLRATPCQIGTRAFQTRASVGLIEVTAQTSAQDVISTAARACRAAQKANQGQVMVYERNAQAFQEHLQDLHLIKELGSGFSPQRLFLEMQPIMSLREPYETLNFEVLLRMHDSNGALIPASRIIAAAEESGTISVIDKWVFATTLKWLDTHREQLPKTQFVCVNLSGMSLNDEKFVDDFFAILARFEHLAQMLCMEITESVALHDMENTRRFIKRLQALGVRIALDDFGAGYTSFSYLSELPADAIKIDGSFIRNMNERPVNVAIVGAIVAMARNLGMQSIAEWVENGETLEALAKMGVDYVQGFAIARPLSPDTLLEAENIDSVILDEHMKSLVRNISSPQTATDFWDQHHNLPPTDWH